jgi:hypothetical protein
MRFYDFFQGVCGKYHICSDARRAGDADPHKKIIAETNKLDGNSSYGKAITNKERQTDVIYCKDRYVPNLHG